jgi:rare lipoprotein A
MTAGAAVAHAATGAPPSPSVRSSGSSLDAATRQALQLQQRADDLTAEQDAIQLRLNATTQKILVQDAVAKSANEGAAAAQAALSGRAIAIYKGGGDSDRVAFLLASVSWDELVTRSTLLTRMLETDRHALDAAEKAAARARKEAAALESLRREDLALRELYKQRVASAAASLAQQKRIVATLTEAARRALAARQAAGALSAKDSSLPGGSSVPKGWVTVSPWDDIKFLAANYAPRAFRATGQQFSGLASWYGKAVDGHRTASGRIFNHEDFTTAHRSLPFGTWLAVTRGDKRVIVVVTDRGPYVAGRVLDLSEAAAQELGIGGVKTVSAEIIIPQ